MKAVFLQRVNILKKWNEFLLSKDLKNFLEENDLTLIFLSA